MDCICTPPKKIVGVRIVTPLSDALTRLLSTGEAATLRNSLCTRWGIANKSHASHGANFSSNQTVANLINDIVTPVIGTLRNTVRTAVINAYQYDIDTSEMVD